RFTTFTKIVVPATLPYIFTGYRLSLGIAWLVIVASEMLTGTPGVGGFLWQEYNSLVYAHILLAIVTIGVIGFALDRLMCLGGSIVCDGVPVDDVRRDTALVFQNYSLLPWFSALENVRLAVAAAFSEWPRQRQADHARRYLEQVGLGTAINRRPSQLSGGMRQ